MKQAEVSIICIVYNHEKYLRKCLDGFVMQKTSFPYEIVIHDDCSTDSSLSIINEYQQKYPELFVVLTEKENQYSKGIQIIREIILPVCSGGYLAVCEGDDYWIDRYKLQKQYDYMKSDPECTICFHNTVIHDMSEKKKDTLFSEWMDTRELSVEDAFTKWNVHTSSMFLKKDYWKVPSFAEKCWFSDLVLRTWGAHVGKVIVLPDVMSVYNSGVEGGATYLAYEINRNKKYSSFNSLLKYYRDFNNATDHQYNFFLGPIIYDTEWVVFLLHADAIFNQIDSNKRLKYFANKVKSSDVFKNNQKKKANVKVYLKYTFPVLWKYLMRIKKCF